MSLSSLTLRWSSKRAPLISRAAALCVRHNATVAQTKALPDIDPSRLTVTQRTDLKPQPNLETLQFGRVFTDHMLTIPWTIENGWQAPSIVPYGPLALEPSATVLHYAQTLFEGMKAYKNAEGKITLFRPDMNMKRMNTSAQRIALPTFNGDALLDVLKHLIRLDAHWIPDRPGYSLYIRPTLIGTQRAIGVGPPDEALLFVILSPVGPYYSTGFKPVALYATTEYSRAAPGGTGAYKLGANYAPGVVPQREAAVQGYAQNLWLHGPEHYLTEVGTMNMFVALRNSDGVAELITPPLDGIILPGVTRDSVLSIAREHVTGAKKLAGLPEQLIVSERPVTMLEVKTALQERRLLEIFGTGTAAIISPVNKIGYVGDDLIIPTGPDGLGDIARAVLGEIQGRQRGEIASDWSVEV